jgi:hypothetical protein
LRGGRGLGGRAAQSMKRTHWPSRIFSPGTITQAPSQRPPPPPFGWSPSPAARGRMTQRIPFPRRLRARVLSRHSQASPSNGQPRKNRGRRSAGRRTLHWPHQRMRQRSQRRPLASRRSTAALATPMKAMAQPQAALRAIHAERRCYLRLGSRSQRCTSHAGHNAGWSMPRTARERGYEPRPQEPHSLRFKDRLEKRPSMSEI